MKENMGDIISPWVTLKKIINEIKIQDSWKTQTLTLWKLRTSASSNAMLIAYEVSW